MEEEIGDSTLPQSILLSIQFKLSCNHISPLKGTNDISDSAEEDDSIELELFEKNTTASHATKNIDPFNPFSLIKSNTTSKKESQSHKNTQKKLIKKSNNRENFPESISVWKRSTVNISMPGNLHRTKPSMSLGDFRNKQSASIPHDQPKFEKIEVDIANSESPSHRRARSQDDHSFSSPTPSSHSTIIPFLIPSTKEKSRAPSHSVIHSPKNSTSPPPPSFDKRTTSRASTQPSSFLASSVRRHSRSLSQQIQQSQPQTPSSLLLPQSPSPSHLLALPSHQNEQHRASDRVPSPRESSVSPRSLVNPIIIVTDALPAPKSHSKTPSADLKDRDSSDSVSMSISEDENQIFQAEEDEDETFNDFVEFNNTRNGSLTDDEPTQLTRSHSDDSRPNFNHPSSISIPFSFPSDSPSLFPPNSLPASSLFAPPPVDRAPSPPPSSFSSPPAPSLLSVCFFPFPFPFFSVLFSLSSFLPSPSSCLPLPPFPFPFTVSSCLQRIFIFFLSSFFFSPPSSFCVFLPSSLFLLLSPLFLPSSFFLPVPLSRSSFYLCLRPPPCLVQRGTAF